MLSPGGAHLVGQAPCVAASAATRKSSRASAASKCLMGRGTPETLHNRRPGEEGDRPESCRRRVEMEIRQVCRQFGSGHGASAPMQGGRLSRRSGRRGLLSAGDASLVEDLFELLSKAVSAVVNPFAICGIDARTNIVAACKLLACCGSDVAGGSKFVGGDYKKSSSVCVEWKELGTKRKHK